MYLGLSNAADVPDKCEQKARMVTYHIFEMDRGSRSFGGLKPIYIFLNRYRRFCKGVACLESGV